MPRSASGAWIRPRFGKSSVLPTSKKIVLTLEGMICDEKISDDGFCNGMVECGCGHCNARDNQKRYGRADVSKTKTVRSKAEMNLPPLFRAAPRTCSSILVAVGQAHEWAAGGGRAIR